MKTVIIGDSCCDLPIEYIKKHQIPVVKYSFHLQENDYYDDFGATMTHKNFYNAVREGAMASTSQTNFHTIVEFFRKEILEGNAVIYLSFSSALSNTYNNAVMAKRVVMEEFPRGNITVIDSKSASLGEGLLLHYARELLQQGAENKEIVQWLEENKLKMHHCFTVEDLEYLKRGGRVSGAAAFIGTVLNIKPVLHVDNEGRLILFNKVRSRKKAIKNLAETLGKNIVEPEKQIIGISHADCLEDALLLKEMILKTVPVKDVLLSFVGPVIGAHAGPGTLALFFLGDHR